MVGFCRRLQTEPLRQYGAKHGAGRCDPNDQLQKLRTHASEKRVLVDDYLSIRAYSHLGLGVHPPAKLVALRRPGHALGFRCPQVMAQLPSSLRRTESQTDLRATFVKTRHAGFRRAATIDVARRNTALVHTRTLQTITAEPINQELGNLIAIEFDVH